MSTTKDKAVHPLLEGTTEGPWKVGHFGDVRSSDGYNSLATVNSYFGLPATANAKLIASAPLLAEQNQRLMDALEEIIYQADEGMPISDVSPCIVKASKLLAKNKPE